MDSRFNFRGSGKQGTCFQICLKQLRKALEIQGAISDFNLFWTAVIICLKQLSKAQEIQSAISDFVFLGGSSKIKFQDFLVPTAPLPFEVQPVPLFQQELKMQFFPNSFLGEYCQ